MNNGAPSCLRGLFARAAVKITAGALAGVCSLSSAAFANPTGGGDELPPTVSVKGGVTLEVEFDPASITYDELELHAGVLEAHACEALDLVFEPAVGTSDELEGVYSIDDGPWIPLLEATDGSAILDLALPTGDLRGMSIAVVLDRRVSPPPTGAKPKLLIKPKKDCDG